MDHHGCGSQVLDSLSWIVRGVSGAERHRDGCAEFL